MPSGCLTTVLIGVLEVLVMRVGWYFAMAAVTVLALVPIEHLQMPVFNWWDKAQHALAFAVLTVWGLWAWPLAGRWVLAGMLVFGAAIELAQWACGWRFAEWADWAADAVGVGCAGFVALTSRASAKVM